MSLRTRDGVPDAALAAGPELRSLVSRRDGRAVLTVAGRLLEREVAGRLRVSSRLGLGARLERPAPPASGPGQRPLDGEQQQRHRESGP